jgi:hypothetical protein
MEMGSQFAAMRGHRALFRCLRKVAALLVISLSVSGCSGLSFLYGLAETALAREANFHLDLDEEGEAGVDRKIKALFAWHSSEMLPRYAHFLEGQAEIVDRGEVDRREVDAAVDELRKMLDELIRGAAPYTASVFVDHTAPEKVTHLKARMAERLAERREELAAPLEDRLEERIERIVDNFERLTGDLNAVQMGFIKRYAAATAKDNETWLKTRASRQRAFTDFLSQRPDQSQIARFIYRILLRPHEIVDPEYKAVSNARWVRFEALLYDMMTSLTFEQRRHASKTLREYAAEMLELSS